MKTKFKLLNTLLIVIAMLIAPISIHAEAIKKDVMKFSSNNNKSFQNADEFYLSNKNNEYKELPNATLNVRKKILYNNIEETVKQIMGRYSNEVIYNAYIPDVDPERQIYLFATIEDGEKTFKQKYCIIDAETAKILHKGEQMQKKRI